ncbi:HAD family hydrolase [Microbacterium sp. IEGM 1404]|uniref:HAD family hydrolase n=1 Tax=Microbacterium sp. IEGM 1404 TaxID=3047084 RepID=UPI0024B7F36E|nr:HAD family hydrolase [Microbacterium sp. IEGM 1404]MDI9892635.1 HAD hydrolase-like protein [Microbacterium sp. IEGM 1404]
MTRIETIVMDMAGTTVEDGGIVVEAFTRAWDARGETGDRDAAVLWVQQTMGQSKIEVFRHLVSEPAAQALNRAFEEAYDALVEEGRAAAVPGAEDVIRALQAEGRHVVLTTGFSKKTAVGILAALGWSDLPDLVLTPAEVGRGRPAPDLNLTALIRTRASGVDAVAVVGDTPSDARSGTAAGAGLVVGVLTGASTRDDLLAAGAGEVIGSVADLPAVLARVGR